MYLVNFIFQEQLALPEPPSSAHERALSSGNVHTEVPATAAAAVPSLLEDPVAAPAPAPVSAPAPAPKPTGVDLLGDLLAPLAIEAAPGTMPPANGAALDLGLDHSASTPGPVANGSAAADPLALALYDGPDTTVQVRT